uniref:Uncharacterized protein n=1 Tax=viral metagenome TaxID=1070528 RepID=A0A6H1ZKN2_9ZZZZ
MTPQVIIVHDIHKSIEDVGVLPYANTLVQDMGGEYWFVDAELWTDEPTEAELIGWMSKKIFIPDDSGGENRWWRYRLCPVPQKLAYFIISALRLKSIASQLDIGERHVEKQTVYLTPGTVIFGHKVERLTEIPAELGPVVVERL